MDSGFSMEPDEMKLLVGETLTAWQAVREVSYGPTGNEKASSMFWHSIYVVEDINEGDELTPQNVRIIRPGDGLPPKYYDTLLGIKVSRDIKKGNS